MGRFVRPEAIEGTSDVTRVFDQVHVVHRACRTVVVREGDPDEIRDRLRRLAKVDHPHLARLVAVGEEDGHLMVVSEWLPGGPLGRSQVPNPGRLLPGVAEALYALHRNGLAHGRLSKKSFVLDGNHVVKLVDACIVEGSVIEDLEAFGRALADLYVGRVMPPELEQIANDASAGRFGDATRLAQALQAVCAVLPPVVVGGDEPSPLPVSAPIERRPAPDEEDERRPLVFWLLLALLPALVLVWSAMILGWWMGRAEPVTPRVAPPTGPSALAPTAAPAAPVPPALPAPADAPPPAPADAPPPAPLSADPIDAGALPVPMPAPFVEGMPAPVPVVVTAAAPASAEALAARVQVGPPPALSPSPSPRPTAPSGWVESRLPGSPHPALVLVLDAENTVQDRLGRSGRPRLELRCANHRLSASLLPGVESVEAILVDNGFEPTSVAIKLGRGERPAEDATLRLGPKNDPHLYFPNPAKWAEAFATGEALRVSYTPFASAAVVARFDPRGLDLGGLRENCRF